MDFIDEIKTLSTKASKLQQSNDLETEQATKQTLILPFIRALGFDIFNHMDVIPEFTSDVGTKKGEKVDYALLKEGKPIVLFECKHISTNLEKEHASQLYRYFSVSEAIVGILTNGIVYKFYSDLDENNKMDTIPFLEFNILEIDESVIKELKRFRKESFEIDEITSAASGLKYTNEIKRILGTEIDSPTVEFVKFFTKQFYNGRMTKNQQEKFKDIAHRAFKEFINERINERLKSALVQENNSKKNDEDTSTNDTVIEEENINNEIVTTEEEMEGFYIVRAILREIINPERVTYRDWKNYFNIQFDDSNRKPICRLYFNTRQKYISLFDESKNEEKVPIENLSEIYRYADKIQATINYYGKKKVSETYSKELTKIISNPEISSM